MEPQAAGIRGRYPFWRSARVPGGEDQRWSGHLPAGALAGALAFVAALVAGHFRSTPYNNDVLLAHALLAGHAWIAWPGPYIDALAYNGQHYVIEGPLPALLLAPFAAFTAAPNQTLLAQALAGVAAGAAYVLCRRLELSRTVSIWFTVMLFAGTSLLWCAMLGDVWFLAHVSAVCFTMLGLCELFGKRRIWLVALYAVCAAESRFTMIAAVPVYAALLWYWGERRACAWTAGAGVLGAAGALWTWYNFARWGVPLDIGYTAWYHQDQAGMPAGSPFRLSYLPYELQSFFVQAPQFSSQYPYVLPSIAGVALTWTSPALIVAFWARQPRVEVTAMWVAAALTAIPNFLYYVNGFAQYGMRHSLDFMPFLFVLMIFAARRGFAVWMRLLILYSCAANLYGVWFWNAFVRPQN
ncbi:MAG: hypothetical protein ABR508_00640 [Candidatus Baltobacteraceae bacterium]